MCLWNTAIENFNKLSEEDKLKVLEQAKRHQNQGKFCNMNAEPATRKCKVACFGPHDD